MTRSGYQYDLDTLEFGRWRGMVASAIRGKRGQQLLRDIRDALDAMPTKELIAEELVCDDGVCALGAAGLHRGMTREFLADGDPTDYDGVARMFGVSACLAQEIAYMNDEEFAHAKPADRWTRMREWVGKQIKEPIKSC